MEIDFKKAVASYPKLSKNLLLNFVVDQISIKPYAVRYAIKCENVWQNRYSPYCFTRIQAIYWALKDINGAHKWQNQTQK